MKATLTVPSVLLTIVVLSACAFAMLSPQEMQIARQPGAPATLVETTHGYPNVLKAAQLKNHSDKPIKSYRIGWAYVLPRGAEFHVGVIMNVPTGIQPGTVYDVPDQAVLINLKAERIIFFVAEATFADGSQWKANNDDIWPAVVKKE